MNEYTSEYLNLKLNKLYLKQDLLNKQILNLIKQLSTKIKHDDSKIKQDDSNIELCLICSNEIKKEYMFNCCNKKICIDCIYNIIKINIEDIQFKPIKCPFCIKIIKYNEIYKICRKFKNTKLSNRYKNALNQLVFYKKAVDIFKLNKVLKHNKVYGYCSECPFEKSIIKNINRRCATTEGDIIVLKSDMFICSSCENKNKNSFYDDLPYKKCPHCGILGKPVKNQCNYLYCDDHTWCYVCQGRLPCNHQGHNVHFWTGPGTSPYNYNCRVLSKSNKETFVLDTCNCKYCSKRDGKGLCINKDCNNNTNDYYCKLCI